MSPPTTFPRPLHLAGFDPEALVVDFGDPEGEARACRGSCALFDFSFLAIGELRGGGAARAIATIAGRDPGAIAPGRIGYALRTDAGGMVRSDLTIWNLGDGRYQLMSGDRRDVEDLLACAAGSTEGRDLTEERAVLAIQGPNALAALESMGSRARLAAIPYFGHARLSIAGVPCRVGRLGYTGERGFELVFDATRHAELWERLSERARPAGFAAADALRIEAGLLLFTNELAVPVTPRELGLERLFPARAPAPRVRLVCFRARAEHTPRLWRPSPRVALPAAPGTITVTSACHSPLAGGVLGLGFVVAADAHEGRGLSDPHGEFRRLRLVSLPFHDPRKRRPRGSWSGAEIGSDGQGEGR